MYCAAAILSTVISAPLWVAKSRLQLKNANTCTAKCDQSTMQLITENNVLSELALIGRTEGVFGLWGDCWSSVISASVNSPLQTLVHEALRRRLCAQGQRPSRSESNQVFTLATVVSLMVVSRCTCTVLTYPLWLVQHRQKVSEVYSRDLTHTFALSF